MCQHGQDEQRGFRALMSTTREERLETALRTLLKYFGGPQGVSLQELGHDAIVEVPMKVRIGDLIAAHEALSGEPT